MHKCDDNEISLEQINEDRLREVEIFVEKNKNLNKNSVYENKPGEIKFLLGHRVLILGIPNSLKESRAKKLSEKQKQQFSDQKENLGQILLEKVQTYCEKNHLSIDIDSKNIGNITIFNNTHKCHFTCPRCLKPILTTYSTYWKTSNINKHLRGHFFELPIINEESVLENQFAQELNVILND